LRSRVTFESPMDLIHIDRWSEIFCLANLSRLYLATLPIREVALGFRPKLIPVLRNARTFVIQSSTYMITNYCIFRQHSSLKVTLSDDCISIITWNSAELLTSWSFSYRPNTTTSPRFTCSRSCLKARPLSQFHLTQRYQKPSNWGTSVKPQTKSCLSGQRRKS